MLTTTSRSDFKAKKGINLSYRVYPASPNVDRVVAVIRLLPLGSPYSLRPLTVDISRSEAMDQYSPKSSPMGSRSPNVAGQLEGGGGGGALKFSIALGGQKPTIIQKGPFYLMKQEAIPASEITGATNLMAAKGLDMKPSTKKMKDSLSSFLSNLPGIIDTSGAEDNSSLRGLIEKPPVVGKELHQLSYAQMAGFRLHPGPLPEHYRISMQVQAKKKRSKNKKHKHRDNNETSGTDETIRTSGAGSVSVGGGVMNIVDEEREKRREKKHKKHDKDAEERKRRKKEKKRKKNKEDKE